MTWPIEIKTRAVEEAWPRTISVKFHRPLNIYVKKIEKNATVE